MADSDPKEQEIARLTAEVARLREARDAYRDELETHLSQAEKFISNELRLLSVSLSREVREDFFAMLRRGAWTLAILGVIATAGGLFTFSGLIDQAVENEVKKREADVAKLRDNVIQSVVDFKLESEKALDEIVSLKSEVAKEGRKSVADFKLESESGLEHIAKLKSEVEEEGRKAKISIRRSAALSIAPPPGLDVVNIPVVVHVVYQEEAQNIADEQILSQIWGESGASSCSGSDNVADTPNQSGPNYGKPTFPHISCENGPHGDLFMNFMDYVDGDSMVMFTKGQVVRMHETLANQRTGLGS